MPNEELSPQLPMSGADAARYRVLFLKPDGSVLRIKPIEASDDAEAIQCAKRLMDGRALDLWEGLRFIEHFPALDEAAEAQ